ncbi:MAG: hypothetical protein LC785_16325 [Acidobacteria bacterium]|nr:hypothetical protein [Acidobacteriota bacterium]MCA1643470.1 hypothetical protein [Acidobacteriota bacterium]
MLNKQLRLAAFVFLLSAFFFNPTTPGAAKPKPVSAKAKTFGVVDALKPACRKPSYPAPAPAAALGIDTQCGLAGSGTGAEGVQDSVKNNFCATGTPQTMTIASLTSLQAKVEKNGSINFGNESKGGKPKGPTTNRAPLKKLGEGSLVTLRAFVLVARQEGGESVNCGKNVPDEPLFHDIHISLVSTADATDECAGVVAEMSPHHRPDSWTHANVEKVARAKLPVRVTGQLYFDSSHFPCSGGQGAGEGNPKRVSLWEVHPIYKFEVCTAGCDGAGTWLPLDVWAKQQ